jgi:hypothetical protein
MYLILILALLFNPNTSESAQNKPTTPHNHQTVGIVSYYKQPGRTASGAIFKPKKVKRT